MKVLAVLDSDLPECFLAWKWMLPAVAAEWVGELVCWSVCRWRVQRRRGRRRNLTRSMNTCHSLSRSDTDQRADWQTEFTDDRPLHWRSARRLSYVHTADQITSIDQTSRPGRLKLQDWTMTDDRLLLLKSAPMTLPTGMRLNSLFAL